MSNLTLRGDVKVLEYGKPVVSLFPFDGQGPEGFKSINSEAFHNLLIDHFDVLRGTESVAMVHGREVRITRTRRTNSKRLSFTTEFMTVRLQEDKNAEGARALLFIELPFDDPASQSRGQRPAQNDDQRDGEWIPPGQDGGTQFAVLPSRQAFL